LNGRDEPQVSHGIEQQATDEEFDRKIINPFLLFVLRFRTRFHPCVDDAIAYGQCGCMVPICIAGTIRRLAKLVGELRLDRVTQLGFVGFG